MLQCYMSKAAGLNDSSLNALLLLHSMLQVMNQNEQECRCYCRATVRSFFAWLLQSSDYCGYLVLKAQGLTPSLLHWMLSYSYPPTHGAD